MFKSFRPALLAAALTVITASCSDNCNSFRYKAEQHPFTDARTEEMIAELYDNMSMDERIAQIHGMFVADLLDSEGHLDTALCRRIIPYGVGHFCQYASNTEWEPERLRDLVAEVQDWLMNNTPNGIPALFHEEVLSGVATKYSTIYPQQIGLACSFNPELAAVKTQQTAAALRKIGGMLALSPMVDVCRTPSFNRLEESYGEDAYLSAAMGTAFALGLQDGGLRNGVAACSKHFLGYGGGGDADTKELYEDILMPHEAMIRIAGSKVVMTGYHAVHGTNAVASSELQEGILRTYLGFDGVMVSDYTSINQIPGQPDQMHRAAAAVNAGNDVEFCNNDAYKFIPDAIEAGLVKPEALERAVKNVLRLKAAVGLLDENPVLYAEGDIDYDTDAERATAYTLATQSVVMLKNNGILPLKEGRSIALTGPNANSFWAMPGDYAYPGMAYFWHSFDPSAETPHIVTLREGLQNRMPAGFTLAYERGCDWTDAAETSLADTGDERVRDMSKMSRRIDAGETIDRAGAIAMAAGSDVIIAAMGENDLLCGENRDRGSLRLPGSQEAYVEELIATGKPVVLVIFGGRAQVIGDLADRCAAVIQAWYPGEEGGNALADIIYGNVSPSGKLSVSYPSEEIYEPLCYNYSIEQDQRVQYPFGFGLSYTEFTYSGLELKSSAKTSDKAFKLSFNLTNSGECAADEIVQIYLSPADGQDVRPVQLQGFGRVSLKPGETRKVTFLMSPQQFGHYDDGQWTIEPGRYEIKVGASSADIRLKGIINLTGNAETIALRDIYFSEMI